MHFDVPVVVLVVPNFPIFCRVEHSRGRGAARSTEKNRVPALPALLCRRTMRPRSCDVWARRQRICGRKKTRAVDSMNGPCDEAFDAPRPSLKNEENVLLAISVDFHRRAANTM